MMNSKRRHRSGAKRRLNFLAVLVLPLVPYLSWGIVDVHDHFYAAPDQSVLSAWSFDFSGASGNDSRAAFSVESHNLWRLENQTWMLVGSYARSDSGGVDTADNQFLHGRFVHQFRRRGGVELFLQTQQDRFQKLKSRHLAGFGYRIERNPKTGHRLLLGLGGFIEREAYTTLADRETAYRANLYLTADIPIKAIKESSLGLSIYVQPRFDDFSDLRSIAVARFETKLTEALTLDFSLAVDRDSSPLSGVEAQNVRYSSGITYTF